MELNLDMSLTIGYRSASQQARRMTEGWVSKQMYCPSCGYFSIRRFENNKPVADFYCPECGNEYELKSKSGSFGSQVIDGAYDAMIKRITSNTNPDFFFMSYSLHSQSVQELIVVPKHFFVPDIIMKRAPLAANAHRSGWIGCNIQISKIPQQGRISIIKDAIINDKKKVLVAVSRSRGLEIQDIQARGWLLDVLMCVNSIQSEDFSLDEVYKFSKVLAEKHPQNHNIKAKIRQQLQMLRDRGFLNFLGQGHYRRISQ